MMHGKRLVSWKRAGHGACPEHSEYTRRGVRRLSTWETHRDALALVDNVYTGLPVSARMTG